MNLKGAFYNQLSNQALEGKIELSVCGGMLSCDKSQIEFIRVGTDKRTMYEMEVDKLQLYKSRTFGMPTGLTEQSIEPMFIDVNKISFQGFDKPGNEVYVSLTW